MRKIYSTLLATSLVVFLSFSVLTGCQQKNQNKIETELEEEENDKYDGMDKAIEFEIEKTKITAARTDAVQALSWIERGPNGDFTGGGNPRPTGQQTSGRIRAVMIDSLDPTHKTVFAGSVAGGLWKTTDITVSPSDWTLVNDFLSNLAIADICGCSKRCRSF